MGLELGWAQHLLQPWSVGRMAWWVSSATAVLSSTSGGLWESSGIWRQLGISSEELSSADVGKSSGVQPSREWPAWGWSAWVWSAWVWSAGKSSGESPWGSSGESSELWESPWEYARESSRNYAWIAS